MLTKALAILLVLAGSGFGIQTWRLNAEQSAHAETQKLLDQERSESFRVNALLDKTIEANGEWESAAKAAEQALADHVTQSARQIAEVEAAKARAEAELRDANRTFAAFREQFDSRPPTCEAALSALDSACPSLRGY